MAEEKTIYLACKDKRRKFGLKIDYKDEAGERHQAAYTVGAESVPVPAEHAEIIMATYSAYIVAVGGPAAAQPEPGEGAVKHEVLENQYWCSKCERPHQADSAIGKEHEQFKEE